MSFSSKLTDSFGKVFDQSPYTALEPLVKVQFVAKGNNVVLGRPLKANNFSDLIYIGKVLENTQGRNYLGADVWLDITYPHVIYITGTRGSGKSFDLGVLLEGISELGEQSAIQNGVEPLTAVLIDTQSQFWTLRYPPKTAIPENKIQLDELTRWNIKPNSLTNCRIFIPPGSEKFLGDEQIITIRPRDVSHEEWCALLGQAVYGPQGHILGQAVDRLSKKDFSLDDMIAFIRDPSNTPHAADASRDALLYKLIDYKRNGLFSKDGTDFSTLLQPNTCNVLMLRELRNEDKSLICAVVARQLFTIMGRHHKKRRIDQFFGKDISGPKMPGRVWLMIDEAHVVAPKDDVSPARDALVEYVKRGRDAGLSLVLATQQPSAVDDRILSQVNVTLNHRLAFQSDINAAIARIPAKPLGALKVSGTQITDFGDMLRLLDVGQCFIGDHSTSRTVMVQVRPRVTSHGGYSPR